MTINQLVKLGLRRLNSAGKSAHELRRFSEIYNTVYHHARKKGQSHRTALRYCWNVYSDQAPIDACLLIRPIMRQKTKLSKTNLRKMIIKEMIKANVINIADFK